MLKDNKSTSFSKFIHKNEVMLKAQPHLIGWEENGKVLLNLFADFLFCFCRRCVGNVVAVLHLW